MLRGWRRKMRMSQSEAATSLGLSLRMYSYYEAGEHDLPIKVLLACRALASNDPNRLTRERWTAMVANVHRYLRGEFVVEPMIRERRWEELADFMRLLRNGPEPDLAMTDPSLFIAIRNAGTKAWLSGILHFKEPAFAPTSDAESEVCVSPRL